MYLNTSYKNCLQKKIQTFSCMPLRIPYNLFSQKFLKQDCFSKVYNNYPNETFLDNFKDLNWTSVSYQSIFETVQCTLRLTEQPISVLTRKRL